jgi:hypothetical protein
MAGEKRAFARLFHHDPCNRTRERDAAMKAYQWFLLGMMVAWTPGFLALALMLLRPNVDNIGRNSADNSSLHIRKR